MSTLFAVCDIISKISILRIVFKSSNDPKLLFWVLPVKFLLKTVMPLFGKIPPLELNNFETAQTERANRCISFQWGEKLRGRREKKHIQIDILLILFVMPHLFVRILLREVFLDLKVHNQQGCSQPQKSQAKMQPNARQ